MEDHKEVVQLLLTSAAEVSYSVDVIMMLT
jgi:hypothetical protein